MPYSSLSCESCSFWQKNYGLWIRNRWTKRHKDEGFCTLKTPMIPMNGDAKSCKFFSKAPEKQELFFPPTKSKLQFSASQ